MTKVSPILIPILSILASCDSTIVAASLANDGLVHRNTQLTRQPVATISENPIAVYSLQPEFAMKRN